MDAGLSLKAAEKKIEVVNKLLNSESITDKELNILDLNNAAMREAFIKATGVEFTGATNMSQYRAIVRKTAQIVEENQAKQILASEIEESIAEPTQQGYTEDIQLDDRNLSFDEFSALAKNQPGMENATEELRQMFNQIRDEVTAEQAAMKGETNVRNVSDESVRRDAGERAGRESGSVASRSGAEETESGTRSSRDDGGRRESVSEMARGTQSGEKALTKQVPIGKDYLASVASHGNTLRM